jgi:transcriptional regulator with XRE-family HTH domain
MPQVSTIEKLGEFVRERRTAIGMHQSELALLAFGRKNCHDHISKLESGKLKGVNTASLDKILHALNAEITFTINK